MTENLIYKDINLKTEYIMEKYNYDNNIIIFNIIENIYDLTNDINTILKLYNSILYIDLCDYYNYQNIYNNIYIFFNTIYPIYYIKNNKINKYNIKYNKYISYSLQYINSINNYNISTDIYYYFCKYLNYYENNKNITVFNNLKKYILHYNLSKKNINSIIKFYFTIKKNKIKSYCNLINKLFKSNNTIIN